MKISRKKLKEIIKEHLDEVAIDNLTQEAALSENLADINNITDLKNLFNMRSQGGTVARFDPTEVKMAVRELERAEAWLRRFRLAEDADKGNVYAICTAQVGREDKEKYEKCVKSMAKKPGYHK